jgi:hypothetical protein
VTFSPDEKFAWSLSRFAKTLALTMQLNEPAIENMALFNVAPLSAVQGPTFNLMPPIDLP